MAANRLMSRVLIMSMFALHTVVPSNKQMRVPGGGTMELIKQKLCQNLSVLTLTGSLGLGYSLYCMVPSKFHGIGMGITTCMSMLFGIATVSYLDKNKVLQEKLLQSEGQIKNKESVKDTLVKSYESVLQEQQKEKDDLIQKTAVQEKLIQELSDYQSKMNILCPKLYHEYRCLLAKNKDLISKNRDLTKRLNAWSADCKKMESDMINVITTLENDNGILRQQVNNLGVELNRKNELVSAQKITYQQFMQTKQQVNNNQEQCQMVESPMQRLCNAVWGNWGKISIPF